jgi:DNA mismatch endonuclease (patch repair protein)
MSVQARRDTAPEMALRRLLFARGYRYRVAYPVPGMRRRTIDIAFTRTRLAVFVDGCFWHGCPQHGTAPKANSQWWAGKILGNRRRDEETTAALHALGWTVVRVWEHETAAAAAARVEAHLDSPAGSEDDDGDPSQPEGHAVPAGQALDVVDRRAGSGAALVRLRQDEHAVSDPLRCGHMQDRDQGTVVAVRATTMEVDGDARSAVHGVERDSVLSSGGCDLQPIRRDAEPQSEEHVRGDVHQRRHGNAAPAAHRAPHRWSQRSQGAGDGVDA